MRLPAVLLVGITLAGTACSPWTFVPPDPPPPRTMRGPEPLDWRALLGCYRSDSWQFAFDSAAAAPRFVTAPAGARQAHSYRDLHRMRDKYWHITPRNTVEFVTGDGLHGSNAEFVVRGDSLVGWVQFPTDISMRAPWTRMVAVRGPCPDSAALRVCYGRPG